jgi:hypothetical protein
MRVNRYPGKCEKCGGHVAKRAGGIVRGAGGRWLVYHKHCGEDATGDCSVCGGAGQLHGGRNCPQCDGTGAASVAQYARSRNRVNVIQTSGGTFYRNANGRCEDAPCCGCCTI